MELGEEVFEGDITWQEQTKETLMKTRDVKVATKLIIKDFKQGLQEEYGLREEESDILFEDLGIRHYPASYISQPNERAQEPKMAFTPTAEEIYIYPEAGMLLGDILYIEILKSDYSNYDEEFRPVTTIDFDRMTREERVKLFTFEFTHELAHWLQYQIRAFNEEATKDFIKRGNPEKLFQENEAYDIGVYFAKSTDSEMVRIAQKGLQFSQYLTKEGGWFDQQMELIKQS